MVEIEIGLSLSQNLLSMSIITIIIIVIRRCLLFCFLFQHRLLVERQLMTMKHVEDGRRRKIISINQFFYFYFYQDAVPTGLIY